MKTNTPRAPHRFCFPAILIVSILVGFCPLRVTANTIALTFTSNQGSFAPGGLTTLGWAFTLTTSVTLTDLGFWDANNSDPLAQNGGLGDGLIHSHLVTLWTSSGTFVTSATVPAGAGATLDQAFRFVSIAPLVLPAGDYVIGALYPGGFPGGTGEDWSASGTSGRTTAPEVVYIETRDAGGNVFPSGSGIVNSGGGWFGPNFEFSSVVPDSGNTILLMLGGIAALRALRLRWKWKARTS